MQGSKNKIVTITTKPPIYSSQSNPNLFDPCKLDSSLLAHSMITHILSKFDKELRTLNAIKKLP